jgi:hypothetical protein
MRQGLTRNTRHLAPGKRTQYSRELHALAWLKGTGQCWNAGFNVGFRLKTGKEKGSEWSLFCGMEKS